MAVLTKPSHAVSQSLLRLQSDARLAQLARDGFEPAFDTLVQRYRPELIRASSRIVGPDRSEDAVQQALLNAHRSIGTTENVNNLRAWLHKIGHNSSLNMLRSLRDEISLDDQFDMASAAHGPAEAAILAEELNATLRAIDGLPENQRAALLLRELEGRSHEDIAAALGLSAGAARQQLMRARQGVRQVVTALTPYPLIAALCTPGTSAGIAELVFGAGASATAVKLGASVAATGAIAGGVFGASVAVQTNDTSAADNRQRTTVTATTPQSTPATAAPTQVDNDDSAGGEDDSGHGKQEDRSGHGGGDDSPSRGKSGDDSSSSGSGGSGSGNGEDPARSGSSNSGSSSSGSNSGSGSSGSDDSGSGNSGSDSSGSGDASGSDNSGRGSQNSGRGGDD